MQKTIKYTVFNTKWGYFGLAGTEYGLLRAQLPGPKPEKIKSLLLTNSLPPNQELSIEFDKTYFKMLQEQITAYFDGACVNFSMDIPLVLDGFGRFYSLVLTTCREIKFGQTITYGQLAKKSGRPAASRAAGNALARNPLPLIIPCHRIVRSDGKIGGFTTPGGTSLKKRMLILECKAIRA